MSQVAATTFTFDLQRFETTTVSSASDLQNAITSATAGDTIKLADNFSDELSTTLTVDKNLTLDLNGQTLTTSANIGIKVESGKTFTVDDTATKNEDGSFKGSIVHTAYDTAKTAKKNRADGNGSVGNNAIKLEDGTSENSKTSFVLKAGNIQSKSVSVYAEDLTNVEINDGTITSENSIAVYFDTNTGSTIGKNTLTMNGGKLLSKGWLPTIQVSGAFVDESTLNTITINGGTVEYAQSDTAKNDSQNKPGDRGEGAIFASGQTALTIKDGVTVTSSHVGIEFRGGTLNVEGGTITSTNTNDKISYHETKRGTSFDDGVAIAVSRSSSEKDITVNIKGGTIQGYTALAVADPNSTAGSETVTVNITGGTLKSTSKDTTDSATYLAANAEGNTTTDKNGKAVALYTLKGKYAIVNFDKQVTVNISDTTVEGNIAAMTKGGTGNNRSDNGYNIGTGNGFDAFDTTGDVLLIKYDEIGDTDNFKVSKLGEGEAFNRPDKDATEWIYLAGSGLSATTVASIGSAAEDSNTLEFTMGALSGAIPSLATAAEIDFTSNLFSKYNNATKFDGSAAPASFPLNIKGNDKITSISGGAGNDSLKPGSATSVSLTGGAGNDLFIFDGNSNTITDFGNGTDSVTLTSASFRPANADFLAESGKITIDFGGGDALIFDNFGDKEVSLTGGHVFTTKYHAVDKQITFSSVKADAFDASALEYATIDAASASAISIMGNSLNNRIIGSNKGGSLNGGAGNDRLIVTDRESKAEYLFEYKAGNDSIEGFDDTRDTLDVDATKITEAKGSGSKLTLTFDKNNSVILKSDVDIEKVSLNASGDYLTNSGYRATDTFKLFANAKGKIDLTDTPYKGTNITAIDATGATKQSVTLTADSVVSSVSLAANKNKDLFEYGGGSVTISGYEAGIDRLNIADIGAVSLFTVDGKNGVSINAGGKNSLSLQGALADQEILIRDGGKNNSFSKFVFHADGVLYNKAKKPTEANIYSNVRASAVVQADDSIKKIFLLSGVSGVSIQSGNNKATLDASEANGVSLIGGAKNNKFIGSTGADLFVYKGGKDNIQDYDANDKLSLDGDFDLSSAKISASSKSLKFKFSNKNTLTLKSDGNITSASIGGSDYSFAKNAVGLKGVVSLTSQFSGTYKLADGVTAVDGSAVKKNLTFKGTDAAESLVGGQKKTTFKGGGGDDIFYGGDGRDIFFYAKTDSGDKTIKNFGFGSNNDKIKIANGTIKSISKSGDVVTFSTNGGSLKVTEDKDKNVLIKANNTLYWFDEKDNLITADTKVSNAQAAAATGYEILDLGYTTNLVKANLATKAGEFEFSSIGIISKKET